MGFPHIWGGTSEVRQTLFGAEVPGGFDCSGLVWRVFKLAGYAGGERLAATLRGRTTYTISAEIPRAERIGPDALEPADLIFFGARGPSSTPAEVGHMAIYLGNGWVHPGRGDGRCVLPLSSPWYSAHFAWGRRPLAEAGLA